MVSHTVADAAAKVLRDCVRKNAEEFVAWILNQEFERFLAQHRVANEAPAVVRNGYQPARAIMTGVGALTVRYPKARSKNGRSVSFRSQVVRRYAHCMQERSDAAEWRCLAAVLNESLPEVLRAALGDGSDQITHVVPDLAVKWANRVRAWRRRSLAEHRNQDIWILTVATPACPDSLSHPLHLAIAVDQGGGKRMLDLAAGPGDCPVGAWKGLVESLQGRGLTAPGRIYSNWQTSLLSEGLGQVAPQWAERVAAYGTGRGVQFKDSVSIAAWDWPAAIHQN